MLSWSLGNSRLSVVWSPELLHCGCCLYPGCGLVSLGILGCLARAVGGVYGLSLLWLVSMFPCMWGLVLVVYPLPGV